MLVCDFCSLQSKQELALCRCFHSFCDDCAAVGCSDDSNFSTCSFCPRCSVECEINNYNSAVELAKTLVEGEDGMQQTVHQPPKPTPVEFLCPITRDLMSDPVVLTDGFSYERAAIVTWMKTRRNSPMTGAPVDDMFVPNTILKVMINEWKALQST
jgi:hypothetical protein